VKSGFAIASSKCLPNQGGGPDALPRLLFAAPAAGNYPISIILGASTTSGGFGKLTTKAKSGRGSPFDFQILSGHGGWQEVIAASDPMKFPQLTPPVLVLILILIFGWLSSSWR
jgi:hypothetical protein